MFHLDIDCLTKCFFCLRRLQVLHLAAALVVAFSGLSLAPFLLPSATYLSLLLLVSVMVGIAVAAGALAVVSNHNVSQEWGGESQEHVGRQQGEKRLLDRKSYLELSRFGMEEHEEEGEEEMGCSMQLRNDLARLKEVIVI